jgi:cytochrome oxidase Cu insertion factor (SCO1/SenC/PrrC family)
MSAKNFKPAWGEMTSNGYAVIEKFRRDFSDKLKDFDTSVYQGTDDIISAKGLMIKINRCGRLIESVKTKGGTEEEILRALKYGLVLLDTRKHHLDYQKAKADFDIPDLQNKYESFGGLS